MADITRRKFFELSAKLAAVMGLGSSVLPGIADALEKLSTGNAPVLWLQGQSCSGCSVSLLNSEEPGPAQILTGYISLLFHSCISAATGGVGTEIINKSIEQGKYILVVEGSVPAGMPEACVVGEETFTKQLSRAAKKADAVVALGSCASFGGIPAAENNPTGAISVPQHLKNEGAAAPVILLPGCPAHPDWLVGTLVHVLKYGIPPLDNKGRPQMFYSRILHDQCPRFADYERENFAKTFSDDGCLFKLGCLGPNTHADCTVRYWNGGVNTCVRAGAPCIACASEQFPGKTSFSMYRKGEQKA